MLFYVLLLSKVHCYHIHIIVKQQEVRLLGIDVFIPLILLKGYNEIMVMNTNSVGLIKMFRCIYPILWITKI